MPRKSAPTVSDLSIPKAARFLSLPKQLSKAAVRALFDQVLLESEGNLVSREIRVSNGSGGRRFVHSFLSFRISSPVPFLNSATYKEVRYGFVLLVERSGYLAVFHRLAKGLDESIAKKCQAVDRRRLTHIRSSWRGRV